MSVADSSKQIIITECLTGKVICSFPYSLMSSTTLYALLSDIADDYLDNGFMVKIGY